MTIGTPQNGRLIACGVLQYFTRLLSNEFLAASFQGYRLLVNGSFAFLRRSPYLIKTIGIGMQAMAKNASNELPQP